MNNDATKQVMAEISARVFEAIGPNMVDTPEAREAIIKAVNKMIDAYEHTPFDYKVECSADLDSHTLHLSFRMPPGFYTKEQIDELRDAGAIIEEVVGE
jgi:hypothetical protein